MKKFTTKQGYIAYKTTAGEVAVLGGFGICDNCNTAVVEGNLVPVMNRWLCEKCFREWEAGAKYYPEDLRIETRNARYYESRLPVEEYSGDG